MKQKLLFFAIVLLSLFAANNAKSQTYCTNGMGMLSPAITNSWNTLTVTGGYYEFSASAGCTYTFTYCNNGGSYSGDPYLTITDLANNAQTWNDDACGLGSNLTWTCTVSGIYLIHLGNCCGGTSVCSFPARTLAYYSTCSACPGTPPVTPIAVSDSVCGSGNITLSANQNGASNCVLIWFQQGNPTPIDTTYALTGTLNLSNVTATTTYYVANYDTLTGCTSAYATAVAIVHPIPNLFISGLDSVYCNNIGAVTLNPFPAGGTLSGNGISGTTFNPTIAGVGTHVITYNYTNTTTGCSNTLIKNVLVNQPTTDTTIYACNGNSITLIGTGLNSYEWYDAAVGGNNIGSGATLNVTNITGDTTFYYAETSTLGGFQITALDSTNSSYVDHNSFTGDDRGGIAVTPNYVYYTGDNNTVRYDFPSLINPMSLTRRDGIISDLTTGLLWTLWDGTTDIQAWNGNYNFNAIRELNTDLTLGSTIIPLSQTITINSSNSNNGMFAGTGFFILHEGVTGNWYRIDLITGQVTILSNSPSPSNYANSENWAYWGIAEYYNGEYAVVYSTGYNTNAINRYNLTTTNTTTVAQFSNFGDVACITYSQWHNKWTYHTEGSTDHAPYGEIIVQLDGTHVSSPSSNNDCRKEVRVKIAPAITASANITTPSCFGQSNGAIDLSVIDGVAPFTYVWSNAAQTQDINNLAAGNYSVTITDACNTNGTFNFTVTQPNAVAANAGNDTTILSGGSVQLNATGGVSCIWTPATGLSNPNSCNPIATPTTATTYYVTVTDANGCTGTDSIHIHVSLVSIAENELEKAVMIYPNPSRENVTIDLSLISADENVTINIIDSYGKNIANYGSIGNQKITIEKDKLASGVYNVSLTLNSNASTVTKKLVIIK